MSNTMTYNPLFSRFRLYDEHPQAVRCQRAEPVRDGSHREERAHPDHGSDHRRHSHCHEWVSCLPSVCISRTLTHTDSPVSFAQQLESPLIDWRFNGWPTSLVEHVSLWEPFFCSLNDDCRLILEQRDVPKSCPVIEECSLLIPPLQSKKPKTWCPWTPTACQTPMWNSSSFRIPKVRASRRPRPSNVAWTLCGTRASPCKTSALSYTHLFACGLEVPDSFIGYCPIGS